MTTNHARLYLITPPTIPDPDGFAEALSGVIKTGDAEAVQIRLKGERNAENDAPSPASDRTWRAALPVIIPAIQNAGAAAIVNDRADLAAEFGADGAHIGQDDGSIKNARALLGNDAIIGATCHNSRHLAMEAGEAGASYVAFGAFYPSVTKTAPTQANPEILEWWSSVFELPCVAIGGITAANCASLAAAGADYVAVSAAVWTHPEGAEAGAAALREALSAPPSC